MPYHSQTTGARASKDCNKQQKSDSSKCGERLWQSLTGASLWFLRCDPSGQSSGCDPLALTMQKQAKHIKRGYVLPKDGCASKQYSTSDSVERDAMAKGSRTHCSSGTGKAKTFHSAGANGAKGDCESALCHVHPCFVNDVPTAEGVKDGFGIGSGSAFAVTDGCGGGSDVSGGGERGGRLGSRVLVRAHPRGTRGGLQGASRRLVAEHGHTPLWRRRLQHHAAPERHLC